MSKNIKISDIDSSKLLNGEMNAEGIKIGTQFAEFTSSSFDNKFDYVRAEAEVNASNELRNKGSYKDDEGTFIDGNYPLNVTFCRRGKIETVDRLDNINLERKRNIDNVFPFNEICLVTKSIPTYQSAIEIDKQTWLDDFSPNRGYCVTNKDFISQTSSSESYVSREFTSNDHSNAFINSLETINNYTTKTFVRIPRFYLRIYFFKNKEDNKYYRRYEIVSPSVYDSLPEEFKFGFFVPKAFSDKKYLYISHTPESFGLVSSPFGSETGYFDTSSQAISIKLGLFNIMTTDVWFGIVHILFKMYIGYMNPRNLLDYPTLYPRQWDGVNSIFSIFHKHVANDSSIFDTDADIKNCLKLDVYEDVFISEADDTDPPLKYIVSNNSTPCEDMKGFTYRDSFRSSSAEIQSNLFMFDALDYSSSDDYLITNIVLWNAAPSLSLDDPDNTPVYCDFSIPIKNSESSGTYYFNCYRYKDRDLSESVLEVIKNNRVSFTKNSTLGKIFLTIQLSQDFETNLFSNGDAAIQYVIFKQRYTGDKKKIVKDTLLGKNVVLSCYTESDVTGLSKQGEVAYIDAQFFDPDNPYDPSSTTSEMMSWNINFLNYDFGTQNGFEREYDELKIKKYLNAWNAQNCLLYLYRHPVHEIAGNYYNYDKRFFVDLYKKNCSLGCRFSLLYFSNFMMPFSYKKDENIANNTFYPKHTTRYNMPSLGNDEVCSFENIKPQQGVLLNDVLVAVQTSSSTHDVWLGVNVAGTLPVLSVNYSATTIGSPIELLQNPSPGKLYCDSIAQLVMVNYTDGILSSVFVYDKDLYYLNFPVSLEIPQMNMESTIDPYGHGIQIEYGSDFFNSSNPPEFMVSSGYLQKFHNSAFTPQSDVSADMMLDRCVSFNLNGFNFIDRHGVSTSKSCQNILLYTVGD